MSSAESSLATSIEGPGLSAMPDLGPRVQRYERQGPSSGAADVVPLVRRRSETQQQHVAQASALPPLRRHPTSSDVSGGVEIGVEIGSDGVGSRIGGGGGGAAMVVTLAAAKLQNGTSGRRRRRSSHASSPHGSAESKGRKHAEMIERFQIRRLSRSTSASSYGNGTASQRGSVGRDQRGSIGRDQRNDEDPPLDIPTSGGETNPGLTGTGLDLQRTRRTSVTASFTDLQAERDEVITTIVWKQPRASNHTSRFSLQRSLRTWRKKWGERIKDIAAGLSEPILPGSRVFVIWQFLLLMAFAVHVVIFPLEVAFFDARWIDRVAKIEVFIEIIFILDFILAFNTAVYNKRGMLVTSRAEIAKLYLRGWFLPDLLSSIPVDTITYASADTHRDAPWIELVFDVLVRSQRFVHLVRVARLTWTARLERSESSMFAWLQFSRYSHLFRIAWIIMLIVIIAHYLACGWKLLEVSSPSGTHLEQYMDKFYDALQLLQGQGVETVTVGQNVFAAISVLLGSIALAIVFGHVAILVSNFNANSTTYQRKMESVFAIMGKLQLPGPLRERIHQYYEHLWREYESLDGEIIKFSKGLSHTLELEVVLYKYMDLVMHVPFWRDSSPDFQKQLMLHLQVRVYLPDDYIIRRGEVGDEFYMINRGVCELVVGPDSCECSNEPIQDDEQELSEYMHGVNGDADTTELNMKNAAAGPSRLSRGLRADLYSLGSSSKILPTDTSGLAHRLRRGQSFGEIALLMNYERTATARALTYVEMCVLRRRDFQSILVKYPKDRKNVLTAMFTKTMEHNELNGVICPLKASVRSVFGGGDASVESEQLSAAHAALLIASAVNIPYDDDSIKFGVGAQLKSQLMRLRDGDLGGYSASPTSRLASWSERSSGVSNHQVYSARMQPMPSPSPAPSPPSSRGIETTAECGGKDRPTSTAEAPPLGEQVSQLQATQQQMLGMMREMHREMIVMQRTNAHLQSLVTSLSNRIASGPHSSATTSSAPPPVAPPLRQLTRRRASRGSLGDRESATVSHAPPPSLARFRPASMSELGIAQMTGELEGTSRDSPSVAASESDQTASECPSESSSSLPPSRRQSFALPRSRTLGSLVASPPPTAAAVVGTGPAPTNPMARGDGRSSLNARILGPLLSLISAQSGTNNAGTLMSNASSTPYADQLFRKRRSANNEPYDAHDDGNRRRSLPMLH